MPVFTANLQKNFKLALLKGIPQATVEQIDGVNWVKCCPLCGCTHQLLEANKKLPYTPLCQTMPQMYKAQQVIWHKLYPEVTSYTTAQLVKK